MATLKDKVVLITGAAGGMGRVEAEIFAAEGARVWLADIDGAALQRTLSEIEAPGRRVEAVRLDVTDPQGWEGVRARIEQDCGELHGLVNNAGVSFRNSILTTSAEDWDRVLSINLTSVFLGMKSMHPLLGASGAASIVNVSSIAGLVGYFSPTYGASKWAVRGLSKTAAMEFAPDGIRVNSIHPGLVETPLLNSGSAEFVTESLKAVPMDRVAAAEEIAMLVRFLLSDESSYITGAELVADGGLTAGGIYHQIMARLAGQATS